MDTKKRKKKKVAYIDYDYETMFDKTLKDVQEDRKSVV